MVAVIITTPGCGLFPQRRVYISDHSPARGMVTVFSSPAELRMNTLIYRPDATDPVMFNAYSNLVHQLGMAQTKLASAGKDREQRNDA